MQFTASTLWNSVAKGGAKYLRWRVYYRKTTTINDLLTAPPTFVEVTDKVVPIESCTTAIEMSAGQFTADSLTVRGLNRQWWMDNVFNASASEYIEFMVTLNIGLSDSKLASETCYAFSGFIDKRGYKPNEETNSVEFTVYTADELGNRLIGENLTTQYINTDVDGAGTDGLVLPRVPGIYITNANIATKVLKAGVHVITYEYNSGTERAKLDDGDWVTLPTSDGSATLQNAGDTERVTIYVSVTSLSTSATALQEDIIVLTAATLPKNWYVGISARVMLQKIFEQIGIDTVTYDTLFIDTWDGEKKVSVIDLPPNDPSVTGNRWALANDGTNIWVGIGNKLYRRVMATDTYEPIFTFGSTDFISQMHHDAANNHLWIVYGVTGVTRLRRYNISGASMSAEITLSGNARPYCSTLFVWTSPSPDEIWFVYCNETTGDVRAVDGATLTDQAILTRATMGYPAGQGAVVGFIFWRDLGTTAEVYFQAYKGGNQWDMRSVDMAIGTPGTWTDGGVKLVNVPPQDLGGTPDNYEHAVYNAAEDRIYFLDFIDSPRAVKSHPRTSNTITSVVDLTFIDNAIVYDGSDKVYISDYAPTHNGVKILYEIDTNVETIIDATDDFGQESRQGVFAYKTGLTYFGGELYGVEYTTGNLWKYSANLALYIERADFEGVTVKEALVKALQTFNLIANISPAKKAFVFRRGNSAGVIQTTGNSVSITPAEGSSLSREKGYQPKIDYVEISNGVQTISYNGTEFDAVTPADSRKLEIENEIISNQIMKDLCYYTYQFWKTQRDMLTVELPLVTLFQYEPCDGASLSGFDEVPSATGINMVATYKRDGSMTLNILTPLS